MNIDSLKILLVLLCFQLLFVSFFLFQSKNGKSISNNLLATVFTMLSIAVLDLYFLIFNSSIDLTQLLMIDDTFMFAYGPLLYLFTQSVLYKDFKFKRKSLLHFIPFMISLAVVIWIILFTEQEVMSSAMEQIKNRQVPLIIRTGEFIMLTHIILYLIKSKIEIKKVIKKALNTYSSFRENNSNSLNFIINSFMLMFGLSLLHSILPAVGIQNGLLITLLLMVLYMFYFINSVLFKMLRNATNDSGIFSQSNFETQSKYAGSNLTKDALEMHKSRLWKHIITEKRFLDSELNIDDLAEELDMSSKMLSQVINEGYACNFFDFINKFRIEAVKELISDQTDEKITIQEAMYSSGFNSKSSFNTSFKKFTGQTPSQFKNSL